MAKITNVVTKVDATVLGGVPIQNKIVAADVNEIVEVVNLNSDISDAKADLINGKLDINQLPDLAITSVIIAVETSISAFASNNENYTYEQGDVIILDNGNGAFFMYNGGGKSLLSSYNEVSATQIDWSQVANTPTAIAGYGITDAYTKTEIDSGFLPLSGGTLTGDITAPNFIGDGSQLTNVDALSVNGYNLGIDNSLDVLGSDLNLANTVGFSSFGISALNNPNPNGAVNVITSSYGANRESQVIMAQDMDRIWYRRNVNTWSAPVELYHTGNLDLSNFAKTNVDNNFSASQTINSGGDNITLSLESTDTASGISFKDGGSTVPPSIIGIVNDLSFYTNSVQRYVLDVNGNHDFKAGSGKFGSSVTSSSFIKTGATNNDVLLGDGTTTTKASLSGLPAGFYEEGTFTPTLTNAGVSAYSFTVTRASYIRVGNTVNFSIKLTNINDIGTPPNGTVFIENLPLPQGFNNDSGIYNYVVRTIGGDVNYTSITGSNFGSDKIEFLIGTGVSENTSTWYGVNFTNGMLSVSGTYTTNVYTP